MYYTCSHKMAGCLGRAQVSVTEQISETGQPFKEYQLVAVSTPEVEEKWLSLRRSMLVSCRQERPWAMILVRMVTPVELCLREEGRTENYFKMTENIQYHFQSPVLPHMEPDSVIKPGSIFAMKTKDNGWTRAWVLSTNKEIKPAAGRTRRACRSWEWGPPQTAFFSFKLTVPAGEWSKASEVAEDYLNSQHKPHYCGGWKISVIFSI